MQKGHGKFEDRLKARYDGENDPLAQKILDKVKDRKVPPNPEDKNITTFFIGGIDESTSKEKLQAKFATFGEV